MKTVDLDIARQLKEAGLKWEPKRGDKVLFNEGETTTGFLAYIYGTGVFDIVYSHLNSHNLGSKDLVTWLPTLPDMLAILEQQGYIVDVDQQFPGDVYTCKLWIISTNAGPEDVFTGFGESRETAVATAILWDIENKKVTFDETKKAAGQ